MPDVARGFVVEAAESEIVDLGTEFVLDVRERSATVAVIEGEVTVRSKDNREAKLTTGQSRALAGDKAEQDLVAHDIVNEVKLQEQIEAAARRRYAAWERWSDSISSDQRLIAYYPIARAPAPRERIPQVADAEFGSDGVIVGLTPVVESRFRYAGISLNFSRPGSRLRIRIDGEFDALTLCCWAKIDSLSQRFNALLMTDGYEPGEPHWQICHDGRLMLSVMAGEEKDVEARSPEDDWVVWRQPWHKVYYSPKVWNVCDSGRWIHFASVYDPPTRTVRHYVDGRKVNEERIYRQHLAKTIRFGNTEIGNWGQPYRKRPEFAVRNLNGAIDEVFLFQAALSTEEIAAIYQMGTPDYTTVND